MRWWARPWVLWLGPLLVLSGAVVLAATVAPESPLVDLLAVLAGLWALALGAFLLYRLWRRLTYRIGVRLFLSYLLIGIMPFVLILAVATLGGYILVGQYTSARFGDQLQRVEEELERTTAAALAAAEDQGPQAARTVLEAFAASHRDELPGCEWLLAAGGEILRSPGAAELAAPTWVAEPGLAAPFLIADELALASVARGGGRTVVLLVPLDRLAAQAMSRDRWYEVRFMGGRVKARAGALQVDVGKPREAPGAGDDAGGEAAVGGEAATGGEEVEEVALEESFGSAGTGEGLWRGRWIYFVRLGRPLVHWSDGSSDPDESLVSFLLTSPAEALEDLFRSPYQLGRSFLGIFLVVSGFFFALYLSVVAVAVLQVVSVARSTARLTRGTQRVEAGDLGHRIPVRRRDQLGNLALSFNRMTAAVEGMMAEVAEKERLKREMELAREIQQSLIPERELHHGALSVLAFFRPAAEVGGDYFDLFPLGDGRLLVSVGDVAGHGLPTGLLMAMLKSAVATLVAEGHRGPELLGRLNRLMLEQPREHRMVTLAVVDLDPGAASVEVTNAGHPPPLRLDPAGEVEEVLLPALPLGTRWREPPPRRRLSLPPGCRLVLYSDGLTEARGEDGDLFGYERLTSLLRRATSLPSRQLLEVLLQELERFTAGVPQGDDLTVLLIERQGAAPEG